MVPGPQKPQLFVLVTFQGASNHLPLCPPFSFTASELSEDSYEDERIYGAEGSGGNSEDSDVQEVLLVPKAWAGLGKKGKIG